MGDELYGFRIFLEVGFRDSNYIIFYKGQNLKVNCVFNRMREVGERNGVLKLF